MLGIGAGGDQNMGDQEPSVTNIALVGRTCYGESATRNTLLGEKLFRSKSDARGPTINVMRPKPQSVALLLKSYNLGFHLNTLTWFKTKLTRVCLTNIIKEQCLIY